MGHRGGSVKSATTVAAPMQLGRKACDLQHGGHSTYRCVHSTLEATWRRALLRVAIAERNGAMFATLPAQAMKRLRITSAWGLLAAMAGFVGACRIDKLLHDPGGGPGTPLRMAFTRQPGDAPAGEPITPAVRVTVQDSTGQPATTFNGPVTVGLEANPSDAALLGTAKVNAVNGVATFADLSVDKAGSGYTLRATTPGATGATSDPFDITAPPPPPPPATHLGFSVQPTNAEAGATITPAVAVSALDASGNTVTSFTGTITVAIGANQAGGTLAGTLSVPAVNGVATFSNLSINLAGNGYTLTASAAGLAGATSAVFNITAPPPPQATQLVFTVQPSKTPPGATITPAVEVTAVDDLGNRVTSFTGYVTIALGHDASLLGNAVLSGTKMVRAVNG